MFCCLSIPIGAYSCSPNAITCQGSCQVKTSSRNTFAHLHTSEVLCLACIQHYSHDKICPQTYKKTFSFLFSFSIYLFIFLFFALSNPPSHMNSPIHFQRKNLTPVIFIANEHSTYSVQPQRHYALG